MDVKYRLKRFLILSALGLTLGACVAGLSLLWTKQPPMSSTNTASRAPLLASTIGGDFSLNDAATGKSVSNADFFGQKYMFIYFGFASCPAICPTELQKMTDAYHALPKAWQERIQPIFITVDPERDTPAMLKDYVAMFMPEMIALTGTTEQIESIKKAYKVYAVQVPEGDSYTIDHSSFIYFMGLDGKAMAMFRTSDSADFITERIPEMDGLD